MKPPNAQFVKESSGLSTRDEYDRDSPIHDDRVEAVFVREN
jgi:hypothetical protein